MKTWALRIAVGVAIVGGALVVRAASGDANYIKCTTRCDELYIWDDQTVSERIQLGNTMSNTFPGIATANMQDSYCWQAVSDEGGTDVWRCEVTETKTLTDAQLLDEMLAGNLPDMVEIEANGNDWDVTSTLKSGKLSAVQKYHHDNFTELSFGLDRTLVQAYWTRRKPGESSTVQAWHRFFHTDTPANWADDLNNGLVYKTISKEP